MLDQQSTHLSEEDGHQTADEGSHGSTDGHRRA